MTTLHETWLATGREITIHTVTQHGGRVVVQATRGTQATREVTAWPGRAGITRAEAIALREARERWGAPGRVRFIETDRREARERLAAERRAAVGGAA